jgi:hypothetical protein
MPPVTVSVVGSIGVMLGDCRVSATGGPVADSVAESVQAGVLDGIGGCVFLGGSMDRGIMGMVGGQCRGCLPANANV